MNSSLSLTILFGLVAVSFGVQFKDCGSKEGVVTAVKCTTGGSTACLLTRGENATLEIDFKSNTAQKKLKNVVHGIIARLPVPFNPADADACNGMEPKCPTEANKNYKFVTSLPVKTEYPTIRLVVKWEIQDDQNNDVICIEIPAQIK
ncbi:NPC2-like protein [Mya arenaria]|uniref:NPC2-like protein n=1 Tax=Mya arenaria TaxID=6604 RepID=A0ABY7F803_MYAAR|nr:NPC intracellular cholesterol transporter 2-like [Mya arenaria]WAR18337.1 NPC2-like protein [Mya arenaria]